ncbi:MAG: CvpA family protein [Pseudomonadota bacterium]|nr:CvpA family protein [Pseudomonadota bacterium]
MLDIFVLISTLSISLMGFAYGLVRLSFCLSGWIAATLLTFYCFNQVRPIARDFIESHLLADIAAGGLLFVGSLIIFTIISQAISRRVRGSSLSFLDRSLGLLAGLILSTLISIIGFIGAVWVINPSPDPGKKPDWIANSKMFPLLDWGSREVFLVLPKNLRKNLNFLFSGKTQPDNSFENFLAPKTKILKKEKRSGYTETERREMDRLIQGQRE